MSGALVTQRQRQDIYLFLFDFYDRKGCICCFLKLKSHDTTFRAEKYHEQAFTGIIHFKVTKGIQLKSGITMGSHASEVLSTKVGQNTIESLHIHSKGSKFGCK